MFKLKLRINISQKNIRRCYFLPLGTHWDLGKMETCVKGHCHVTYKRYLASQEEQCCAHCKLMGTEKNKMASKMISQFLCEVFEMLVGLLHCRRKPQKRIQSDHKYI